VVDDGFIITGTPGAWTYVCDTCTESHGPYRYWDSTTTAAYDHCRQHVRETHKEAHRVSMNKTALRVKLTTAVNSARNLKNTGLNPKYEKNWRGRPMREVAVQLREAADAIDEYLNGV